MTIMLHRRLTLVVRDPYKPDIDWNYAAPTGEALTFLHSRCALRAALSAASELELDVGRVIVDRAAKQDDLLDLFTALPSEFAGDALCIRDDGSAVMSAPGRDGDRILYSLDVHGVRFYLETLNLVTGRVAMERTG